MRSKNYSASAFSASKAIENLEKKINIFLTSKMFDILLIRVYIKIQTKNSNKTYIKISLCIKKIQTYIKIQTKFS